MAYQDFSLDEVCRRFKLTTEPASLFPDVPPATAPAWLSAYTARMAILAYNSEKSRSDYLIAPMMVAVAEIVPVRIAVFSGYELDADPAQGLTGTCDFILSLDELVPLLINPFACVHNAPNADIDASIGSCIAYTYAVRQYRADRTGRFGPITGCVTDGEIWQFLRLRGNIVDWELRRYHRNDIAQLLGVLAHIVNEHYRTAGPAE